MVYKKTWLLSSVPCGYYISPILVFSYWQIILLITNLELLAAHHFSAEVVGNPGFPHARTS
jgi:hypothetical protein